MRNRKSVIFTGTWHWVEREVLEQFYLYRFIKTQPIIMWCNLKIKKPAKPLVWRNGSWC